MNQELYTAATKLDELYKKYSNISENAGELLKEIYNLSLTWQKQVDGQVQANYDEYFFHEKDEKTG